MKTMLRCCFLSSHHHDQRKRRRSEHLGRIMLACIALAIVGICTMSDLRIRTMVTMNSDLDARIQSAEARMQRWQSLTLRQKLLETQVHELSMLRQPAPLSAALATFCNSVPSGMLIDQMTVNTTGRADQPLSVVVAAPCDHKLEQAQLINALAMMRNVHDVSTGTDPQQNRFFVKFNTGTKQ